MTLREAAQALRERRTTSLELTRSAIDRINRLNPKLNAFLTVLPQSATDRAMLADRERENGIDRGPLHGIPVAVKDVFDMRGVRTTGGSRVYDYVASNDAAAVEALESAGAVVMGKLNMHELAFGITSNNPHFGPVRNPWDTDRMAGGSSGGSAAAVAAELVYAALGTDTGGSIRVPSSYCGLVGLKPTYGRISRHGMLPLAFSLDHVGPITRDVRDAGVVMQALTRHDTRDPACSTLPVADYSPAGRPTLEDVRLGFPENFAFEHLDADVESSVRGAVARAMLLGAQVKPVRLPDIAAVNAIGHVILLSEAAAAMAPHVHERECFGSDVLALLDQGSLMGAADYINAQRLRRRFQQEFSRVWSEVDCLILPTTPNTAPRLSETVVRVGGREEDVRAAATRLVRAFNVLGLPSLTLPCGLDSHGLPIGLQLVGPAFCEAALIRYGAALEEGGVGIPPVLSQNPSWS